MYLRRLTAGLCVVIQASALISCGGGGGSTSPAAPASPQITSLYPNAIVAGHYDATVSVLGSNFTPGTVVNINGTPVATRYFSSSKLRFYVQGVTLPSPGTLSVTVTNPAATKTGTALTSNAAPFTLSPPNFTVTTVSVGASSIVWNASQGVFYFLIPASAALNPNTIGTLDPVTQAISYTPVPSGTPQAMEISGDDQYLYLYSGGSPLIQRLTLPGLALDITVTTTSGVYDLKAAPGASRTIAVSLEQNDVAPSLSVVMVYDDAVPRTYVGGDGPAIFNIAWGDDTTRLYAMDSATSTHDVAYFGVDSSGVDSLYGIHHYPTGNEGFGMTYDTNTKLLYLGAGTGDTQMIDPVLDGWAGRQDSPGLTLTDATTNKAFQLFYTTLGPDDTNETTIASFDLYTHDFIEAIIFTPAGAGFPYLNVGPRPIRFGTNGLAFVRSDGIYLITGSFVDARPAQPTGGPDGPATSVVDGQNITVVDAQCTDIIGDPASGHLFVSRGGYDRISPNVISEIDPESGAIVNSVATVSDPGALAIASDGSYLYVGNQGAGAVDRYMLPALALNYHYSLGWNEAMGWQFGYSVFQPMELAVAPGQPQTLAVQLGTFNQISPTQQGGIRILDDSVARPDELLNWPSGTAHESIQWGATPSTLLAVDNENSGPGAIYAMPITSSGLSSSPVLANLSISPYAHVHYDATTNRIYTDDGLIFDATTGASVGAFAAGGVVAAVDGTVGKAFYLSGGASGGVTIIAYDLSTLMQVGELDLPNVAAYPSRLVRWGTNGLAFNGADGEVWIMSGTFVQ